MQLVAGYLSAISVHVYLTSQAYVGWNEELQL